MATNYENKFYKDYEKLQNKYDKKCTDYKHMELRAEDYANIRSYIETCRLYGKIEYYCLTRLVEGNPYTFAELYESKKIREKSHILCHGCKH